MPSSSSKPRVKIVWGGRTGWRVFTWVIIMVIVLLPVIWNEVDPPSAICDSGDGPSGYTGSGGQYITCETRIESARGRGMALVDTVLIAAWLITGRLPAAQRRKARLLEARLRKARRRKARLRATPKTTPPRPDTGWVESHEAEGPSHDRDGLHDE